MMENVLIGLAIALLILGVIALYLWVMEYTEILRSIVIIALIGGIATWAICKFGLANVLMVIAALFLLGLIGILKEWAFD